MVVMGRDDASGESSGPLQGAEEAMIRRVSCVKVYMQRRCNDVLPQGHLVVWV
jgi:hypothetical protein